MRLKRLSVIRERRDGFAALFEADAEIGVSLTMSMRTLASRKYRIPWGRTPPSNVGPSVRFSRSRATAWGHAPTVPVSDGLVSWLACARCACVRSGFPWVDLLRSKGGVYSCSAAIRATPPSALPADHSPIDPRLSIRRNCRLRQAIWRAQWGLISNGYH